MSKLAPLEKLKFLSEENVRDLATKHGTPIYVNSRAMFTKQVKSIQGVVTKTPLTIRYAMKANHNHDVLKLIHSLGVKIDASSGYEVEEAIKCGFAPEDILLTSQELPKNLKELVKKGIQFNATSFHQLEEYGALFPGHDVTVRINPGVGSGFDRKVTTAGVSAGFGIWHEYLDRVFETSKKYNLRINRLHTHIGAGSDVEVWKNVIDINLKLLEQMPTVDIVNVGGGFKVARMSDEKTTDMNDVLPALDAKLIEFSARTGRTISVEIEPGTYIAAPSAAIICEVIDTVDTGKNGYTFIRTNTGMNDLLRPALYGAQHPLIAVSRNDEVAKPPKEYIVIGHCCESGDAITVAPGNSEELMPRTLPTVEIGDYIVIEGCGAYCASMSAKGYNGFPETLEIMI
ncbi:diaminopimelate decarboxylase [Candidatus Microgenomates bacterium]|nr:diaminopimelate decarboxylase [Candidatus Microgenomates bacterium]